LVRNPCLSSLRRVIHPSAAGIKSATGEADNGRMDSHTGPRTPAPSDAALVSAGRERSRARLRPHERWIVVLSAGGVVAAALAIWLAAPPHHVRWTVAALLVMGYAAASRVRFEVGAGSAAPTQLAFAPMMVLLPPALLVPAAFIGYVLGSERRLPSGKSRWEVTLIQVAGCSYAVGAAAVMAISGVDHPSLSAVAWYCAAFAVQCTLDLLVSVFQERVVLGAPVRDLVSAMAPCWMIDCLITPVTVCLAASAPPLALASALPLLLLFRIFSQERSARYDQVMALSDAYRGTAMLLGDVVEADHQYTGAHSRDVVELSLAVADRLGLDSAERTRVEFAALLHDVGKIKVPKQILDKPGALSHEERQLINKHTIWGEQMLTGVGGLLADVGHIVRSCHERWDGHGYPDGLSATTIPIAARIVCTCDAFSAMTTNRPYRSARGVPEALRELRDNAGTQFDPTIVSALLQVVKADARACRPHGRDAGFRDEAARVA
jgi:HD-GYP domain-containing protein (c-di-GMP phosphodiesterase class II)